MMRIRVLPCVTAFGNLLMVMVHCMKRVNRDISPPMNHDRISKVLMTTNNDVESRHSNYLQINVSLLIPVILTTK